MQCNAIEAVTRMKGKKRTEREAIVGKIGKE